MHCTRLYLMALNDHSKGEDTMRKRIRVLISALLFAYSLQGGKKDAENSAGSGSDAKDSSAEKGGAV